MKQIVQKCAILLIGVLLGMILKSSHFVGCNITITSDGMRCENRDVLYRNSTTIAKDNETLNRNDSQELGNGQTGSSDIVGSSENVIKKTIYIKEKMHDETDIEMYSRYQNDDQIAKELYHKVRVLCWIMTTPDNLQKKAVHIKATWGKRCNKLLFMSDIEDKDFPAIGLATHSGRRHLTAKTMRAFDYVYKNHLDDADWFLKADDDTYVIMENLRYFLSAHAPDEKVYFGQHLEESNGQDFFSGGAGYVLSKEALKRFAKRDPGQCASDRGAEDVEIGRCMQKLGIKTGDSRDKLGRSRFHCFNLSTHLHGGYSWWFLRKDKYGARNGPGSISDNPISFHYIDAQAMYELEYFVYHLNAYGIVNSFQDLNRPVHNEQKEYS